MTLDYFYNAGDTSPDLNMRRGTEDCVIIKKPYIAGFLSWLYFGEIHGIREGTLISALIIGSIARFFIKYLSYIDKSGNRIFHLPFTIFPHNIEKSRCYPKD